MHAMVLTSIRRSFFTLLSISLLATSLPAQEPDTPEKDSAESPVKYSVVDTPPIRGIVMFSSGLSQLNHEGTVDGNSQINMRFDRNDIDNVLKSLVFEDTGGGLIHSVEYTPALDALDVAAEKLGPPLTLAQTLQKHRGEKLKIETASGPTSGSIFSIETRQIADQIMETITLLNDDGFHSIPLNDLTSINFENEELREEFKLAMAGLRKPEVANTKELNLLFEGKGERKVRFSYNVDSPIWRMTYRLDVKEKTSSLQGWAHVDNVTGVDWKQIQLDLRSGRPQSFHVDLFSPVLTSRSSLGLNIFDIPAANSLFTSPGSNTKNGPFFGGGGGGGFGGGGFGGSGFGGGGRSTSGVGSSASETSIDDISSAIKSSAINARASKMVRFKINEPVTLKAGRSAMLPVLKTDLPVQLFTLFDLSNKNSSASTESATPTFIAQIENTFQLPLIPGPVTLYKSGDFVGDSAMKRIEVANMEEVVYGADQSSSLVQQQSKNERIVETVEMVDRNVTVNVLDKKSRTLTFKNEDSLPRRFLLKIRLTEKTVTPKPVREKIDSDTRVGTYELDCKPNSSTTLKLVESKKSKNEYPVRSVTAKMLETWTTSGATIQSGIKQKVDEIAIARKKADAIRTQKGNALTLLEKVKDEQSRLVRLIQATKSDAATLKIYLKKLNTTEEQLSKLNLEIAEFDAQLKSARSALEKLD